MRTSLGPQHAARLLCFSFPGVASLPHVYLISDTPHRENNCPQCRAKFASKRDCKAVSTMHETLGAACWHDRGARVGCLLTLLVPGAPLPGLPSSPTCVLSFAPSCARPLQDPSFDLLLGALFGDIPDFERRMLDPSAEVLEAARAVGVQIAWVRAVCLLLPCWAGNEDDWSRDVPIGVSCQAPTHHLSAHQCILATQCFLVFTGSVLTPRRNTRSPSSLAPWPALPPHLMAANARRPPRQRCPQQRPQQEHSNGLERRRTLL